MTDRIPVPVVHPDSGATCTGRIGDQHHGVPIMHSVHVALPVGERNPVDGRPELGWLSQRERGHAGAVVRVREVPCLP
jgi:hypothetical protein